MKPIFFFLLIFLGFAESGPDTNGCIVGKRGEQNKNKFSGLSPMNTIVLVFCSNFNSDGCNNPPYEADEDGFYRGVHFPCKHFTGDANNEGKPVISFFSKVVVEDDPNSANVMRFYPQVTDKSGLFLTKTFMTKVSSEGATKDTLSEKVAAVAPRYSGQEEEFTPPEISCFHTDENDLSSTEISDLDGKTGKVHCTYTAQCDNLKRTCNGNLRVRTSTAVLVGSDADAEDGVETVEINNDYYFLQSGDSVTNINCGNNNEGTLMYNWFKNGQPIDGENGKTYSYNHENEDTILQCQIWQTTTTTTEDDTEVTSTKVTATYIWNVFTVEPVGPVEPEVTEEDIKVTHKQNTDFDYTSEVDSFPSPWGLWYWLGDEQGAVKQFEKVTGENNQFSFTKNISYSNFGNFKFYLFNGIGEKVLAKDYKTVFVVKTEVNHLNPIPVFWYEYNEQTSPREVYYVNGDKVKISCNVTKEAEYDIWWKFGEEYFHLSSDDGNDVLKRLVTSDPSEEIDHTMETEEREGWSIEKFDDEESLGLQTKQDFTIAKYTSSNDEEEAISVKCFLVSGTSTSTVAQLISIADAADDSKLKVNVRIFTHTARPVVKGPLNQIQSEKEAKDMVLNCKTNGVPPAFIYFMFTDNKTDGINVTKELSKDGHDGTQFTRYKIKRISDNLTSLTITKPTEKDEGKFTCYAINRDTTEETPVAGPDADVFIEERCSEGAQFCFKNFVSPLTSSFTTSVLLLLILFGFS